MPVPRQKRRLVARVRRDAARTAVCGIMLATVASMPVGALAPDRQPQVYARIPLETIGVTGFSTALLGSGASLLTVHFLDDSHLLVTFGTHGLVHRIENDPKEDQDRMIAAEVVELPSGKVLARSEWQAHDHGRYLWNLGRGRFLIRIGNEIEEMEPLARLDSPNPLRRIRVVGLHRPSLLLVSPDNGLLTMETMVRVHRKDQQWGDVPQENLPVTTLVEFYRLHGGGDGSLLSLEAAGHVFTPQPLFLPVNGDGVLYAEPHGKRSGWTVNFSSFGGKTVKAAEIDSTCDPQLALVSRSEFVALTCRGVAGTTVLKAYAFDGHEAWEEPMAGMADPVYAVAPDAGRFAVVRKMDAVPGDVNSGFAGSPERQEMRVYQTESGDQLLKVELTPAFRTAENFDLAADGSLAVAVHDKALLIYKLPAPDKQDLKDMELAGKAAPPVVTSGPISLPAAIEAASLEAAIGGERPVIKSSGAPAAGPVAPAAPAAAVTRTAMSSPVSAAAAAASEQPAETARRTPPTLLKPGEKPEFGKANPQPQDGSISEGPQ